MTIPRGIQLADKTMKQSLFNKDIVSVGGSKQVKQSHSSLVGRTKDYYKAIGNDIASSNSHSHANDLTEHELMINDQVRKVLQHVKKIQTQVRQKPNSLTRMQFLH